MDQNPPTLLGLIDGFLVEHSMSPITFGRKAMNDPHFVRDLRDGRDVKVSTVERVRSFMDEYSSSVVQEAA